MKLLLTFFLLVQSFVVIAETFRINGTSYEFVRKNEVLLSQCQKTCEALKLIQQKHKIDLKALRKKKAFASSIGSEVCLGVYQGHTLLGVNAQGDGRAFCLFKDKSMAEINSLSEFLKKQGIKDD